MLNTVVGEIAIEYYYVLELLKTGIYYFVKLIWYWEIVSEAQWLADCETLARTSIFFSLSKMSNAMDGEITITRLLWKGISLAESLVDCEQQWLQKVSFNLKNVPRHHRI